MNFKDQFRRIYGDERARLRASEFCDRNLESPDLARSIDESEFDLADVENILELTARNFSEFPGDILGRSNHHLIF